MQVVTDALVLNGWEFVELILAASHRHTGKDFVVGVLLRRSGERALQLLCEMQTLLRRLLDKESLHLSYY